MTFFLIHRNIELNCFSVDANLCYTRGLGQNFGNYFGCCSSCKTTAVSYGPYIFRLSSQTCKKEWTEKGKFTIVMEKNTF